jgi:sec-independent protein translocase protein TatA
VSVSGGELVLLLLVALLALGARRLPEAGGMVGKGLREFHRALNEARGAIDDDPSPPRPAGRTKRLID